MKTIFKYILIASVFLIPVVSLAAEFRTGENPSTGKDEVIANDLYIAGGSITSAGKINGDLVIGGGNIVISGDIKEDLTIGGGNISIFSNVGDDIRVGGGTIIINGKIGGDLIVGGGQVTISGPGINGDMAIGGGNIRIDAPIIGDLLIGGGNVYINAPIGGNVKINADKITLGKNAIISGNLNYKSSEEIIKEDGAVIKGVVDFELIKKGSVPSKVLAGIFSVFLLLKFLSLLVCALVVGLLLQRYSKEIITKAIKRPLLELGRGIIVMILIPIISLLLLITVIGIPFGILGLLGFIIMMLFAWIIAPIILGSVVYRYFSKKELEISWKTILLGVVIFILVGLIPFIGSLVRALLILITLGVITAFKLQVIQKWR